MKTSRMSPSAISVMALPLFAVGLVGWTGCNSERQPITAATSKYEAADSTEAASPPSSDSNPDSAGTSTPAPADDKAALQQAASNQTIRPSTSPGATEPGTASEAAPASDPPTKPSANPPTTVPTANQEKPEIQKQLDQLASIQQRDPRGATREETIGNLVSAQQEIVKVATKILASDATENSLMRAAQAKVQSLSVLSQLQPESASQLDAFVADLKKHPNAQLVQLGRHLEFAQSMQSFANGEGGDAKKLLAEFKQVFNEQPKDAALFQLSQQVTEIFLQKNLSKEAGEAMSIVAEGFEKSSDPQLVNASKIIREQKAIIDVDLDSKFTALLQEKPNSKEEFMVAIDRLFAEHSPGANSLQFLSQMLTFIETRDMELADKLLTKMSTEFDKKGPTDVAAAVKEMAGNFAKRKAIIGQPFAVEGNTIDGKPFDWKAYEGKVVLIDFWATWCRPCLEEIPNIKQNYDQYHSQGFEVVGINIDENPEDVQRFFSRQKLPWTTVVSADPEKQGFQNPLLEKTGAEGIPFLILIGRDGKAIALNPRGPELGKRLAAIFGEPSGQDATEVNPLRPATPAKDAAPKG